MPRPPRKPRAKGPKDLPDETKNGAAIESEPAAEAVAVAEPPPAEPSAPPAAVPGRPEPEQQQWESAPPASQPQAAPKGDRRQEGGDRRQEGQRPQQDNRRQEDNRRQGDNRRQEKGGGQKGQGQQKGGGKPAAPENKGADQAGAAGNDKDHIAATSLNIAKLQAMSMTELNQMARELNVENFGTMRKHEVIFHILQKNAERAGVLFSEGVLEVLPEGFGFLRSQSFNYLPCPEDIYVSPSQIRRFDLQTGNLIAGQIRPPKEKERFFALLKVEAVDQEDPDKAKDKTHFDNLTPLFPNKRFILEVCLVLGLVGVLLIN